MLCLFDVSRAAGCKTEQNLALVFNYRGAQRKQNPVCRKLEGKLIIVSVRCNYGSGANCLHGNCSAGQDRLALRGVHCIIAFYL